MRKYRDVKLDTELEKEEFPEEDDIFCRRCGNDGRNFRRSDSGIRDEMKRTALIMGAVLLKKHIVR